LINKKGIDKVTLIRKRDDELVSRIEELIMSKNGIRISEDKLHSMKDICECFSIVLKEFY